MTPSVHPEVPDFVPPGRGLGLRQSMGWRKVCSTAASGIWVLKGDTRGRMPRQSGPPKCAMVEAGIIRHGLGHVRARLSVFIRAWT